MTANHDVNHRRERKVADDPRASPLPALGHARQTADADDIFRRAAARRPDALALVDPPNRAGVTTARRAVLTFAQADRMIAACRPGGCAASASRPTRSSASRMANTVDAVVPCSASCVPG